MAAPALTANLESPLPPALPAGRPTALYCAGTAWVGDRPARGFQLRVNGRPAGLEAAAMPRFDMPVRRSGFWGIVPVRAGAPGQDVVLSGWAPGCVEVELGRIAVVSGEPPAAAHDPELIAVCMATFEPDPDLLAAQLRSIAAQTHTRWTCVISDDGSSPERYAQLLALTQEDPRFAVSRSGERLGFYRNFERALALAPPQASLIALADQDDVWHPDKLSALRSGLGGAMLVYSDQRIVDREGRVLRETMWHGRANNRANLASLLVANSVTGAAALMRREVLERALPFPDAPGLEFHDHWLALVALACGELAYLARPLYDYVQHGEAVVGGAGPRRRATRARPPRMRHWRAAYFLGYVPGKLRAQTLLLRAGDRLTARKRRALALYLSSDRRPGALAWFLLRPLRRLGGRSETLASEWELAPGIAWILLARLLAALPRWPERWLLDARFPGAEALFEQRRLRRWRESL
jgi:glycosyltransferase involved in cell wall biosynthesis